MIATGMKFLRIQNTKTNRVTTSEPGASRTGARASLLAPDEETKFRNIRHLFSLCLCASVAN